METILFPRLSDWTGRREAKSTSPRYLSQPFVYHQQHHHLFPLPGSIETEEDFSWEDEEEDTTSTTQRAPDSSERSLPDGSTQASLSAISDPLGEPGTLPPPLTPTHTSPRESSDESYDLLSSENDSTNEGKRRAEKKKDGDDPDSDWE